MTEGPTRRLQELLHHLASRAPIRQAILAVESGDRAFRWFGVAGERPDGARLHADTPFFLASIDKLHNAVVALKLSERRRLDLDAPLPTYLPDSVVRGLHRAGGIDRSDRITVRHLLGHTSGLADWLEDAPKGGRSLVEHVLRDGDIEIGLENLAARVRELTPHFPPQDLSAERPRARYSDTNYMLLVAVIEAAAGRPLHEVHEEMLFRPLGLCHTWFEGWSRPLAPTPEPAPLRAEGRPLRIPRLMRSIRGMYGTAADMLAFLRALVRGEVFEDPATPAEARRRWNRFGFPLDRAALRAPGWPVEYGLGLMRFRLPRLLTPARAMPSVIGHTGSTGCWLLHCPERDLFLAGDVGEVTAGAVPYRIVPRILEALPTGGMARVQDPAIRAEAATDRDAIRAVHAASFPDDTEAGLVDALREAGRLCVSLVAEEEGRIVGHAAFSPVTAPGTRDATALGPVAVLPAFRRRGIAERLIRAGLAECERSGRDAVVLLGDPDYYRRFGFEPARSRGWRDEWGGGEAFQALVLRAGATPPVDGLVRYAPEFAAAASGGGPA